MKEIKQEEILELIRQSKSKSEIADILSVSQSTVHRRINKIDPALIEEAEQEAERKKQEEILELIRQGKLQTEMTEILGVSQPTVSNRINKIDPALVEEAEQEAERKKQEEILELIRQGKLQTEITEILGVSQNTASNRINKIDPVLVQEAKEEAKKREQEEILELIRQGKSQTEIADILGVSQFAVNKRINEIDPVLIEEVKREAERRKREEILELIRQGKSQTEMARILKVSQSTVYKRINKIDPALVEEAEEEAERKKKEEILELIRQGKSKSQIADILSVSQSTVYKRINKIDPALIKEAEQKAERRREQEEILDLIRQNKSKSEIPDTLGVPRFAMNKRINEIDPALVKEAEEEAKRRKQEEILELIRQGKSKSEIAGILGVSQSTVSNRINKIAPGLVKEAEEAKRNKMGKKEPTSIIRKKMKEGQLTVSDVKAYRSIIDEKYDRATYNEIVLLINGYIKTKQITEAIRFLNMIINDEGLQCLDIEKIKNLKIQVEQIQKRQLVRGMLRDGKKIDYIMQQTKLKETEVLSIKREMEQRLGREI